MQLLIYIIVFPLLWLLSLLPFWFLYFISDIVSFILFRIIGYRKDIINENLKLAFPNKSNKERVEIRNKFYKHFTDIFIEMLKSITISEKTVKKRFVFEKTEILKDLGSKGKSIVLVGSHYANWEWMVSLNNLVPHDCIGVGNEIGNKYFEKMMKKMRTKYGGDFILPREARKTYINNYRKGLMTLNALVSDQTPTIGYTRHWAEFLNVFVPVHVGAEEIAKMFNMAVVFYEVTKVKRGHYKCTFKTLAENPKELPNYEITEMFLKEVERQVYAAPEYYFWTHRRFKHKDKYQEWLTHRNNKAVN